MISVITPNFNGEQWLSMCLSSVANQTLDQSLIEMIVVDDGSTDASVKIIESYSTKIPGLRLVRHQHVGLPGILRNVAIKQARGEYVLFLDSDDFLGVEALERLYRFVGRGSSDVVAFQLEGLDRDVPRSMFQQTAYGVDLAASGVYKTLGTWKLCRRQFLEANQIRFSELGRGEDTIFFIEAMLRAEVVSVISGYPFYVVRGRTDGSSITQKPWNISARIDLAQRMAQTIQKWAKNQIVANHFMIRVFHTDAIGVLLDSRTTKAERTRLKHALSPFWSNAIEQLVYTAENRRILTEFFGKE